jgi:hypothetical protein
MDFGTHRFHQPAPWGIRFPGAVHPMISSEIDGHPLSLNDHDPQWKILL